MNGILSAIGIVFVLAVLALVIYGMIAHDSQEPERNGTMKHKCRKISKKYGLHIYKSENPQFPYYVREWDECFTEQEIYIHTSNYTLNSGLSEEYGLHIYKSENPQFPYYVREWDEHFESIGDLIPVLKDWWMTQGLEDGFQE